MEHRGAQGDAEGEEDPEAEVDRRRTRTEGKAKGVMASSMEQDSFEHLLSNALQGGLDRGGSDMKGGTMGDCCRTP